MRTLLALTLLLGVSSGCKKDAATDQCVTAAKAYVGASDKRSQESGGHLRMAIQLCPMACERGVKEACDADNTVTVALCDLEGKDACQRMCDEDKNTAACEKVKGM